MSLWQKPSVWIALFFISFNVGYGVLGAAGVWGTIGIQPDPGGDLADEASNVQDPDPGQGTGSTLFGLYNSLAGPLEGIFNFIFPGFAMLKRVGVPHWLVNYPVAAMALVPTLDMIDFFRSG